MKQPVQQNFNPPNCPSCKQNTRLEFDKSYYCRNCENIINKQKHQLVKKVRRQDHMFSTRLPYANTKIREIFYSMANAIYKSTEDMISKLQEIKGKTNLKFYKKIGNYYDSINIRMDKDSFAKKLNVLVKIIMKCYC